MQIRTRMLLTTMVSAIAMPLAAQTDTTHRSPWEFYHGCWSTSSNGAVGPMVCVVPDSTPQRVEMISVVNDVVMSRLKIDADGRPHPFARGACNGFERANWSPDGQRLYMQAEYLCRKGLGTRKVSNGVIAPTRADAFTHVERTTSDKSARPVVVNFIVQLDTTVFPAEVKRRLASYRALSVQTEDLEVVSALTDSTIAEASRALDLAVVDAWLADRGQPTYLDRLVTLRGARYTPPGSPWPPRAYFYAAAGERRVMWSANDRSFLSDGSSTGLQTIWQSGYPDQRSFYDGNTSWLTSQYMATTGARHWQ